MARLGDIRAFYEAVSDLKTRVGGFRTLAACHGRMNWPEKGVYFFFEEGETRRESGSGLRVVRVGTHALKEGSRTTLWKRLRNHKGAKHGGGNHRGSVFRKVIGAALMRQDSRLYVASWGRGSSAAKAVRQRERLLERRVSAYIGAMPFLWLEVGDEPSPESLRGYIERNSIALLSNWEKPESATVDPPSKTWLGRHNNRDKVRQSGLWNSNHVDGDYDSRFLGKLAEFVSRM